MQFGPISRTPLSSATDRSSSARASPSGVPSSPKPAVKSTAAATPARPQSAITLVAAPGGVATIARSTGSPMAETLG